MKKKGRLSVLIRVSLTGCNWTFEVVVAVVVDVLVGFLAGKKQLDENGEVGVVVCVFKTNNEHKEGSRAVEIKKRLLTVVVGF